MLRSLEDFRTSTETLLAHIAYEKESQLFFKNGLNKYTGDSDFESEFRSFVGGTVSGSALTTKIFSYRSSIISLYGYLERFLEDVIVEYLKRISDVCPEHNLLPPAIKKNHLNLSMDLINKIQKIKGWSEPDRKAKLSSAVKNMNQFLGEQDTRSINYDAFVIHTSNFRYDTIHEIFSKLGIESVSKQCLGESALRSSICERHGIEADSSDKVFVSHLTLELDDLAHRRNEVSHGARIDDIDSQELTVSRIKLIKSYVDSIASVVEKHIRDYTSSVSPKYLVGQPDCIFTGINVIGFKGIQQQASSGDSYKIEVGDTLLAVNEDSSEKCISGKILALKRDNIDQKAISIPCSEDVSIELDFKFSQNFINRSIFVVMKA